MYPFLLMPLLTCSLIWCLEAKESWMGCEVVLWCSHIGWTWAAGPISACSHTIATPTNTLGLTLSHKCVWTDDRADWAAAPVSTSSIQTLVVRASFFSFCGRTFFISDSLATIGLLALLRGAVTREMRLVRVILMSTWVMSPLLSIGRTFLLYPAIRSLKSSPSRFTADAAV